MTARQRILAALRCEQPDRVPIIVRGVNPYSHYMNWRGEADPSYQPLIDCVRSCCDVEHLWSAGRGFFLNGADLLRESRVEIVDGWKVTHSAVETPRGALTSVHRKGIDGYSPQATVKHWITDEEDVERFLSLPFALAKPDLQGYFDAEEELGEAGYVLPHLSDPIEMVHGLLGSELLAIWSIEAPHLLRRLLDAMCERCMGYVGALLEGGVRLILGLQGPEEATPPLVSPRSFDDLVTRYDGAIADLIHSYGCLVYMHCHGFVDAVLERFVGMGVDVLHPVEAPPMGDVTIQEAKRRIGDRVCLSGGIQIGDVMTGERSEIVELTKTVIGEGAEGGGFILTLSSTPFERVLSPRTLDNLLAMIETGLEYGRYPLR